MQEGNVEHMLTCGESVNKFKKDIVDFLYNWVKEEVYCHKQSSWKLQNTFNNTCMKTIRAAPQKHQFILIVGNWARYRFTALDMSTGLNQQSISRKCTQHVDTELKVSRKPSSESSD